MLTNHDTRKNIREPETQDNNNIFHPGNSVITQLPRNGALTSPKIGARL